MSKNKFTSDIVIGLEIHVELKTNSKLFCSCARSGDITPNSRTCPVCLGHPGSKPVLNKKCLEFALRLCLALNCKIAQTLVFSRKSYFYPDMSKNYQISQYELPLGNNGTLKLKNGKVIGITRVHMEEDPAALIHPLGHHDSSYVLIDYNRSGNPLCEIVTEPDLENPEEAREFMNKIITMLDYLEIFDINDCIIKADANVSIKESGYIRSEIKNVTGFKEIERALFYEVERQKQAFKSGEKFVMDTRTWYPDKGFTTRIRTKETEADYGYIIDPDLVEISVTESMIKKVKDSMPELADEKLEKFKSEHGIASDTAEVLAKDKHLAKMFEEVCKEVDPDLASKWVRRELSRVLNYNKLTLDKTKIEPKHMISLLKLIHSNSITEKVGQRIIEKLVIEPFDVDQYVKSEGLATLNDSSAIESACKDAIKNNQKTVDEYKSGNEKSFNFLVGQVMRATKGKASPDVINKLLKKLLE